MNQLNSNKPLNPYVYHFQLAQLNLTTLIQEERLQKRIRKSKQRLQRSYD